MSSAVSERKLEANRLNALKSTGPKTPEGKATSSRNAIKHAVFCKNMVIHGEDPEDARHFKQQMLFALNPNNVLEMQLAEQIIHDEWRIKRARAQEEDIFDRLWRVQRLVPGQREILFTPYQVKLREDARNQAERWQKYELRFRNSIYRAMKELREMQGKKLHDHADLSVFTCSAFNEDEDAWEQAHPPQEEPAAAGSAEVQNEATVTASDAPAVTCDKPASALSDRNRDIPPLEVMFEPYKDPIPANPALLKRQNR